MITKEQIQQDIRNVSSYLKKTPSKNEYKKHGKHSMVTVVNRFTTFNKALEASIGSVNQRTPEPKKKTKCTYCNKILFRQPSSIVSNNVFCDSSCAAKYNNKFAPKKQKTKKCKNCSKLIYASNTYCPICISKNKHIIGHLDIENKTLSYFKNLRNDSSRYTYIRQHARKIALHRPQVCVNCDYDKHVEVCHIKEIKSFKPQTKIKTINNPKNLIILCRNCHWELDHGLLIMGLVGLEPTVEKILARL